MEARAAVISIGSNHVTPLDIFWFSGLLFASWEKEPSFKSFPEGSDICLILNRYSGILLDE